MFTKTLWRFILAGVMTVLIVATGNPSAFADGKAKRLEGSWRVTITGGPGTPTLPTWYQALVTFGLDGGLVATITDPLLQTGHGAWGKTRRERFAVTILLFQFSPAGSFLGTLKARATLEVNDNSDTFDSDDYQFEFFDPVGNPTGFVGVGTAHGTRIKVEPLP
jgi:hypothetical protein